VAADAIWSTRRAESSGVRDATWPIEDDHLEFLEAGIESVDIIDLDYPAWHKATDDLAHVSAKSSRLSATSSSPRCRSSKSG